MVSRWGNSGNSVRLYFGGLTNTKPHVQFLLGFHYLDMIHEVTGHMTELNLQPPPLYQCWAW